MFFDIGVKDIIDVLLVAFLLYYFYRLMKDSGSLAIFSGILVFVLLWIFVSQILQMKLIGSIFNKLMNVGVLALIVIFQDEIRRFFKTLGSHKHFKALYAYFSKRKKNKTPDKHLYMPVVMACMNMAKQKIGALIVIEQITSLTEICNSGEKLDAIISQRLIENIFFKNSPLHDGALIIRKDRLVAAACILPVSHEQGIPKHFGLRHRSALGISEESDAIAIIVSEETGTLSIAHNSKLKSPLSAEQLERFLSEHS